MPTATPTLRPLLFPSGPLPWLVPAVITGGLAPAASIAAGLFRGTLGANPVAEALNELGLTALVLLVASMACTPVKALAGWNWPIRVRKTLGLLAFSYACLHVVMYAGVDQLFDWTAIWEDIVKRPFIWVGLGAFTTLVPLAVTSTVGMLKRLGFKRWKRLHRLAYLAGGLGCVHFFLRVKKDVTEPLVVAVVLGVLLAVRVAVVVRERVAR